MALIQFPTEQLCCDEYMDHILDEVAAGYRPATMLEKIERFHEAFTSTPNFKDPNHTLGEWEHLFYKHLERMYGEPPKAE